MSRIGIALSVVLAGLLAYMIYLAFEDAATTGGEPDVFSAVSAWILVVIVTLVVYVVRQFATQAVMRRLGHDRDFLNKTKDER